MNEIAEHYDLLIEEGNDPVWDPEPLKAYMDQWDGTAFLEDLGLDQTKAVLEIGVGTGRLARRAAPLCGRFTGVDVSSKTVLQARENLREFPNVTICCQDFLEYAPEERFDVIYSSLTFLHIRQKDAAVSKVSQLLKRGGRFVLSIDKNQDPELVYGSRKIPLYPDRPETITACLIQAGFEIRKQYEREFAHIFVAEKPI